MAITSNDAWILQSIFHTEGNDGADITSIIAYADYVNHAIIKAEEWAHALTVLCHLSILTHHEDKFQTSTAFKIWWQETYKSKTSVNALKEMDEIHRYLLKKYEADWADETQILDFHLDSFQNAVATYCKSSQLTFS